MTKPQPIPEGYGTVTPWVVTKDTRRLLQFIKEAFDAEELGRVEVEGGAIGHAEARIGDSIIMMFDSPCRRGGAGGARRRDPRIPRRLMARHARSLRDWCWL